MTIKPQVEDLNCIHILLDVKRLFSEEGRQPNYVLIEKSSFEEGRRPLNYVGLCQKKVVGLPNYSMYKKAVDRPNNA